MEFPSEYPRQARLIAQQIENELSEEDREALRVAAGALGRATWRGEIASVRDRAFELLERPPSAWRASLSRLGEYQRRLHLCGMLICAREGTALLAMLSSHASLLSAGGSYRSTLAIAAMLVHELEGALPDPYWPLAGNPFED